MILLFQLVNVNYKGFRMKEINNKDLKAVIGAGACYGYDIYAGDSKVCIGVYVD